VPQPDVRERLFSAARAISDDYFAQINAPKRRTLPSIIVAGEEFREGVIGQMPTRLITRCFTDQG